MFCLLRLNVIHSLQFLNLKKPKSMTWKKVNVQTSCFWIDQTFLSLAACIFPPRTLLSDHIRPKCYRAWIIHPQKESGKRGGRLIRNFLNRVTGAGCETHLHDNLWPWKEYVILLSLLISPISCFSDKHICIICSWHSSYDKVYTSISWWLFTQKSMFH